MKKKPLVTKKDVATLRSGEQDRIRNTVLNQESVSGFLRVLADELSTNRDASPDLVKSATLVRIFLENQSRAARRQYPKLFEEKKNAGRTA